MSSNDNFAYASILIRETLRCGYKILQNGYKSAVGTRTGIVRKYTSLDILIFFGGHSAVIYSFSRDLFTHAHDTTGVRDLLRPACGRIAKRLNLPRNMLQRSVTLYKPT